MIRLPLQKLLTKIIMDFLVSFTIFSVSDTIREVRDLFILAISVVILNAVLLAVWSLVKMGLRLIKRKIEIKMSKSKDEKSKEIMNTSIQEIKKHIAQGDKIIEKINEKSIKTPEK